MADRRKYFKEYKINNKERIIESNKQYRKNNKEKCLNANKKWWSNNPNYMKKWRKLNIDYNSKYYEVHKEDIKERHRKYYKVHCEEIMKYRNKYEKVKRKTDMKYNLNNRIRILIWKSLKGNKNGKHWENLVGYKLDDLIKHLKTTMPEGYTWQDYLDGNLHIDHIIPISAFNFSTPKQIDFKRCWALENLRLLSAEENLRKNAKLSKPFQPALKLGF